MQNMNQDSSVITYKYFSSVDTKACWEELWDLFKDTQVTNGFF